MVEGGTPNTLQRNGITRDSIKIGTVIVVVGLPGEGWTQARQRPRHHLPRRAHAVHGIVGHRRAQGRQGSQRETQAERTVSECARGSQRSRWPRRWCRCAALRGRLGATGLPRAANAARHAGPQWHLAGQQHRQLGSRTARGADGARGGARRGVQRATRSRRRGGRRDPVSAGGAREAQRQPRRLGEARSRGEVLHAGHSARHVYALPVSDRAVGRQHPVHLRIREHQPHRPLQHARRKVPRRRGWDGRWGAGTARRS